MYRFSRSRSSRVGGFSVYPSLSTALDAAHEFMRYGPRAGGYVEISDDDWRVLCRWRATTAAKHGGTKDRPVWLCVLGGDR